jgi:nucleoid-associated protein YgaU
MPVGVVPVPAPTPIPVAPQIPAPPAQPAPTPTPAPTPPAAGVRRHTVAKGDTLMSISQRYYGNRSRWKEIYAANRDVLPAENALKIGMQLKIPQ